MTEFELLKLEHRIRNGIGRVIIWITFPFLIVLLTAFTILFVPWVWLVHSPEEAHKAIHEYCDVWLITFKKKEKFDGYSKRYS